MKKVYLKKLLFKAHECHRTLPDTINIWSFFPQPDPLLRNPIQIINQSIQKTTTMIEKVALLERSNFFFKEPQNLNFYSY